MILCNGEWKYYLRIARPDHWIKNIFVIPGLIFAVLMIPALNCSWKEILFHFLFGMAAVCLIASANYTINEWLDAPFDKYHPVKRFRPCVSDRVKKEGVYLQYFMLWLCGGVLGYFVSLPFFVTLMVLAFMGIIYNVKPFRSKDRPFIDILSESFNNPLRLLLGWLMATESYLPPLTLFVGYWLGGAFLMTMKRFAEYRMILTSNSDQKKQSRSQRYIVNPFAFTMRKCY